MLRDPLAVINIGGGGSGLVGIVAVAAAAVVVVEVSSALLRWDGELVVVGGTKIARRYGDADDAVLKRRRLRGSSSLVASRCRRVKPAREVVRQALVRDDVPRLIRAIFCCGVPPLLLEERGVSHLLRCEARDVKFVARGLHRLKILALDGAQLAHRATSVRKAADATEPARLRAHVVAHFRAPRRRQLLGGCVRGGGRRWVSDLAIVAAGCISSLGGRVRDAPCAKPHLSPCMQRWAAAQFLQTAPFNPSS